MAAGAASRSAEEGAAAGDVPHGEEERQRAREPTRRSRLLTITLIIAQHQSGPDTLAHKGIAILIHGSFT